MSTKDFLKAKREGYEVRSRKDLTIKRNNNSADYIAPNFATGCAAGCSYCYVARHNQFGNPITLYDNVNEIIEAIVKHSHTLPPKYPNHSNQQHRWQWVYDIGECTDMMSSHMIELTNVIVRQLLIRSSIMPTFATKLSSMWAVNQLEEVCRPRRARIRVSLMPQSLADVVEVGTVSIDERIKSIREIYNKGYEVHINFSPVIIHDDWVQNYIELFKQIDAEFSDGSFISHKIKQQLACEVIFLTHHPKLHESNMLWNPKAEKLQWAPEIQEYKTNNRGASDIVRYKMEIKKPATLLFNGLITKFLPYCNVRYIF